MILNGNWVSGDGDNEGIYVSTNGNVGVGTSAPGSYKLLVNGALRAAGNSEVGGTLTVSSYLDVVGQITGHGQIIADYDTVSPDTGGVNFYGGNWSVPRNDLVFLDLCNEDFRVVGSLNGGAAAVWAYIDSSSGWQAGSSASYKTNITALTFAETAELIQDFAGVQVYRYERNDDPGREEIGVISETTSPWIRGSSEKSVSPTRWLGYLTAIVKHQQTQIEAQQREIAELRKLIEAK